MYGRNCILNELNMKINTKKTKVLVLCSGNNSIRARIHLQYNQGIEQVKKFTYLGSMISEDGRSKIEKIKKICQAKISFNQK